MASRRADAMTRNRLLVAILVSALPVLAGACAPPVGAVRVDPHAVQRELTGNVLTTGKLSRSTKNILFLYGLLPTYEDEPGAALGRLRDEILAGRSGEDLLPAAAELSFLHADQSGNRAYYFAAAVYAWAFLFPDEGRRPPDAFDPRLRMAADLYNRGITLGLSSPDGTVVELRPGTYDLPWGKLDVAFDEKQLIWDGRRLIDFVPVAELKVEGLEARFRRAGIGAALAAGLAPATDEQAVRDLVAPRLKVSVTALLRFDAARRHPASGTMASTLELYPETETETVRIEGRTIPLEAEPTAALAWGLQEAPPWKRELQGFFGSVFLVGGPPQLVSLSPHRYGRIPVVFVHGTASSAGRWAEMVNVLSNDPAIRERYEFWFFSYDTANAIVYSSMLLRDALTHAVSRLDPAGTDPGLKQMIVIGHSQGGLLTKMTAVTTGSKLYDAAARRPLDELQLSDETRALIRHSMFVEPLPFVKQVIFICTPHRGSFQAREFVANLLRRIVSTPARLAKNTAELLANRDAFTWNIAGSRLPTAVDNMSPLNPFVRTLARIPVDPGIAAYSIIAVKGDGPIESGDDGVVRYQSAHIDGVKSELVVRWDHSVQGQPEAIQEVRRILLLDGDARR